MIGGLALALRLLADPAVNVLRNEVFAQGYSEVVRKLNRPTMANSVVTRTCCALEWCRRRQTMGAGHGPASGHDRRVRDGSLRTCIMGVDENPDAVVDSRCHVGDVKDLSVVDASMIPSIVRGNTNLPTLTIAAKF